MTCDEKLLVAYLAGDLNPGASADVDRHLLSCEACWRAVREDRAGRAAVQTLREVAPPDLADRVRLAVGLHATSTTEHSLRRHRRGLVAAAAALVLIAAGTTAGLLATRELHPQDATQVRAVVQLAAPHAAQALYDEKTARHLMVQGQPLEVRAVEFEHTMVVVATSSHVFPAPSSAHAISHGPSAWMATRGNLSLYSVTPRPGTSVLIVAPMPVAELPQIAAQLHLV